MKVIITSPVQHDDKTFAPGEKVDLSTKVAQALIAAGAAESQQAADERAAANERAAAGQSGDGSAGQGGDGASA